MKIAIDKRATTLDIYNAARDAGFATVESLVLGCLLFWTQTAGGVERDGKHWNYKTAGQIAGEIKQSVRTVQRTLAALYKRGVLAHEVHRAPHSGRTTTFFRPLESAEKVLAAARLKGAAKKHKVRASADVTYPEPPADASGITQIGGSKIQKEHQKDGLKDETTSASASADSEKVFQGEKIEVSFQGKKEEVSLAAEGSGQ